MAASLSEDKRLAGRTKTGCLIRLVPASRSEKYQKLDSFLDASSRSRSWGKALSPFNVGPVSLYDGYTSENVENAWQYCKVFGPHVGADGMPTEEYFEWAKAGWADPKANRYPMGRGAKPEYSYWNGKRLGYMDARLTIYCPLYAQAVLKTDAFAKLKAMTEKYQEVVLADPDAQDYLAAGKTLKDVLFDSSRALSHSVVLAMLLCEVPVWEQFQDPTAGTAAPSTYYDQDKEDPAHDSDPAAEETN